MVATRALAEQIGPMTLPVVANRAEARSAQRGDNLAGLSPIAATLTGWFWLAEPLTPGFAVGLVLALAGVSLAVLVRR